MVLAATDPTTILLWSAATAVLLFAVAGGFYAGVMAAPLLQDWAVRRASSHAQRMSKLVFEQVDRARQLCTQMAVLSQGSLNAEEWQRLDRVQKDFQEAIARCVDSFRPERAAASADDAAGKSRPESFSVDWIKTPIDAATGLPNHSAYDLNLAAMLAQSSETDLDSGLLLVRMDKADSLHRRLGHHAAEKLLGRLASVVVRSARDEDLLCRVNADTLALLCPSLPPAGGTRLSERIREQVRSHHFHAEEIGPEVLVTASFGYANCSPGDSAELVRDRAADGLAKSQSLGRNQLHVHDGEVRALCRG